MNELAVQPRETSSATERPFISVIVPVRNEETFIADTLAQLLSQDYDPDRFEILVADGCSTDNTRFIVQAMQANHSNLQLLDNPGRLSSAGRNVAVRAARGDLIVLIDGHCQIDNRHYLANLAGAFKRSGADCVGRPQPLNVTGATALQRAIALARSARLGHHPASHIYSDGEGFVPPQSVAVAYRREVFGQVGLFDETFDACEDVEFNHRVAQAGLRCYFTPGVQVRYYPRTDLTGLFRQMVRYGRGRVRLLRKHPDSFSLPGFLPAAFLAGVVAGPLLALLLPVLLWGYLGVLGAYVLTVLLCSLSVKQRELDLLPRLPLVFLTIHAGAGVGVWLELLTRRKRGSEADVLHAVARQGDDPPRPTVKPAPLNALTIDVEDYYHVSAFDGCVSRSQWDDYESRVVGSTQRILDCLGDAGVHATFFVLGWVAQRQPELIRAIRNAGHEIGCHSHEHRLIYEQTPEEFRADLRRARAVLEDVLGERVEAYRAPSFSITQRSLWALDILIEEGFTIDSSIYPTHHDRYGIPGTLLEPHRIERAGGAVWEFPPPVWRCLGYPLPVGGGGYFRLYPYALTRRGLRSINAAGRPFAFYLHPWELDPEQPHLRPGVLKAFRHYVNLRRTQSRLVRLLRDFRFAPLSEVLAHWYPPAKPQAAAREPLAA
jgi:succinoglycan biosynthesis protein ExoA